MTIANLAQLLEKAQTHQEQRDYPTAIAAYTQLLTDTTAVDLDPVSREMRLTALRQRGQLQHRIGQRHKALEDYQQLYLEAGGSTQAVDALVMIGNQQTYLGQYQAALEAHQEARELAQALNYTNGRAQALGGTGLAHIWLGRLEEALSYLQKAIALFDQLGDAEAQAINANRLGITHLQIGQIDKAITAFQKSYQLSEAAIAADNDSALLRENRVNALDNLGECYQLLHDMEQAMEHHQQGLALAETAGFAPWQTDLARNLGVDLIHLGRWDEGVARLQQALALSQEAHQPHLERQTLYNLAQAEADHGDLAAARRHAETLQQLALDQQSQTDQARASHVLGLIYEGEGDLTQAEQLWQQALFLAHETGQRVLLMNLHANLARIAANPALQAVHNRIAAEVIEQIVYPIEDEALKQTFLNAAPIRAILEATEGER